MALCNNSQYMKKAVVSTVLRMLGGEIIGLSFALFYVVAKNSMGILANIVFGICTAGCAVCLLADQGLKLGGKIKGNVTLHKEKPRPYFGLVLGIIAAAPYYISYVFLILSKLSVIPSFTGFFKLINACFFPVLDAFAKSSTPAADIPVDYLLIMAALPLMLVAACHISYKISYNNIDVASRVLYKNKDM